MKEFEPYLKQIKEGKLKEPKEKRTHDFKLLIERTGLTLEEANDLLTLACMKDSTRGRGSFGFPPFKLHEIMQRIEATPSDTQGNQNEIP